MTISIEIKKYIAGISRHDNPTQWAGTAFVISDKDNGYVATCYHVIGNRKTKTPFSQEWQLWFQDEDAKHLCRAVIDEEHCDPSHDTAVLRLIDPLPQDVKVCKLYSLIIDGDPFRSYGFAKGNRGFSGLYANGVIRGIAPSPSKEITDDVIHLRSTDVEDGMSGAPVFIRDTDLVVGFIWQYYETKSNPFADLAFAHQIKYLLGLWPELKNHALPKLKYEREYHLQKSGRANPKLIDFLEYCYPQYPLLERQGRKYPITVFRVQEAQSDKPDTILGNLDVNDTDESGFIVDDRDYLDMRKEAGGRMDDNPTYVIKNLVLESPLKINGGIGTYFQALRTSDALEWEILAQFGEYSPSPKEFDATLALLKNRYNLHKEVNDPIVNGDGRSGAIAMSTLIVFNNGDNYKAFVSERSSEVAVHGRLYHVIPSFMFQPVRKEWIQDEWSVTHQMYREFLEELFDMKELEDPEKYGKKRVFPYWFYSDPNLLRLKKMLKEGRALFHLTGVAVNLLNLRPEILTLLIIKDPAWIKNEGLNLNWEWSGEDEAHKKVEKTDTLYRTVEIDNDDAIFNRIPLKPDNTVPPGAAAFWLGVDMARKILGIR
jgi:hypothetical protein